MRTSPAQTGSSAASAGSLPGFAEAIDEQSSHDPAGEDCNGKLKYLAIVFALDAIPNPAHMRHVEIGSSRSVRAFVESRFDLVAAGPQARHEVGGLTATSPVQAYLIGEAALHRLADQPAIDPSFRIDENMIGHRKTVFQHARIGCRIGDSKTDPCPDGRVETP